ncbi:hypothetical protein HPB51_019919 [Rhipicephalus microplus]|uniref:Uncharacterized protein n=1 Tax=Rhipicephalus microplus TaxID=6941 RepID=A0A9J6E3T2_RHIMP|nr:hypothetical protein HPB51_019919 [Rhipicephalus microplus]
MPTVGLPVGKPASTTTMGCSETAGTAGQALEAVLQVLSLKGSQRSSLRLPGELETLSEKQLLFLAFCMRDCAGNETSSRKCNGVLRRTWYFGNTFECILGDYMHPKELAGYIGDVADSALVAHTLVWAVSMRGTLVVLDAPSLPPPLCQCSSSAVLAGSFSGFYEGAP